MKRLRYTFQCPVCRKFFTYDEPGEPCCTGPSESEDVHEMTIMHLHSIQNVDVHKVGERRAAGQLLMPHMAEEIEREVRLLVPYA